MRVGDDVVLVDKCGGNFDLLIFNINIFDTNGLVDNKSSTDCQAVSFILP